MPALVIFGMATSLIFLIREPTIKNHTKGEDGKRIDEPVDNNLSVVSQVNSLCKQVWQECQRKPKYIFCFVCLIVSRLMNVLFAVYIQLWVMSFKETGVLASK